MRFLGIALSGLEPFGVKEDVTRLFAGQSTLVHDVLVILTIPMTDLGQVCVHTNPSNIKSNK